MSTTATLPAKHRRPGRVVAICGLLSLVCLAVAPFFGQVPIEAGSAWRSWLSTPRADWGPDAHILGIRIARTTLAWLCGGALAVAGAVLQTLLRNGLATPFTLGVSSAGSFGAFLVLAFPTGAAATFLPSTAAMITGLGTLFLVLGIARRSRRSDGLLLAGVTLNFLFGAAVMLVRYLADPYRLARLDRWLMGALDVVDLAPAVALLPWLVIGIALLAPRMGALDQLAFDEDLARARGIDPRRAGTIALLGAGVLASAVVAWCGPIGFVGLLVPHAIRPFTGLRHAPLLAASWLAGGGFLVLADLCARSLAIGGRGSELPVGILTALVGGPFFLWLLVRSR